MRATVRRNEMLNGIEVIFTSMPPTETIESLKRLGFWWSQNQGLWYHYYDSTLFEQATKLFGGLVETRLPSSPLANLTNRLGAITITKACKQISSHVKIGMSVSVEAFGVFPKGHRPHLLSQGWAHDEGEVRSWVIKPLYANISSDVRIPDAELKLWIRALPIKHYSTPIPDQWKSRAEELARKVDVWFTLIDLDSGLSIEFDDPRYKI